MVQPRYNFTQIISVLWLSPLVLSIIFVFDSPYSLKINIIFSLFFLVTGFGFLFKKKWVRYFSILLMTSGSIMDLMPKLESLMLNSIPFYLTADFYTICSYLLFITAFVLLIFNVKTTVAFERKAPIDYNKVLQNMPLNQSYFLKNTVDLTTCLGLMLIAISFPWLFDLYTKILNQSFVEFSNELYLIAFGPLICGIGIVLKLKASRYLTLILLIIIVLFSLSKIDSFERLMTISRVITGSLVGLTFIALLFHPLTTHSFDNTAESIEDYDNILDAE